MLHYYKAQREKALNINIEIFPDDVGRNMIVSGSALGLGSAE
jgi:hypothetical protein